MEVTELKVRIVTEVQEERNRSVTKDLIHKQRLLDEEKKIKEELKKDIDSLIATFSKELQETFERFKTYRSLSETERIQVNLFSFVVFLHYKFYYKTNSHFFELIAKWK